MYRILLAILMVLFGWGTMAAAAPKVVVTIKPVHSLVAGVMEGVVEPQLLLEGAATPHGYSMKPSQVRALSNADLVVWVGPSIEGFMVKPVKSLLKDAKVVELMETPGVKLLPAREGGAWEGHGHDHGDHDDHGDKHDDHGDKHVEKGHGHDDHDDHDDHGDKHAEKGHGHDDHDDHDDHGDKHAEKGHGHDDHDDHDDHGEGHMDAHLWLSPENAAAVVLQVTTELSGIDPKNAKRYQDNSARMLQKIAALEKELHKKLVSVKGRPYLVFHDAYQYFEKTFGLNAVGSITVDPERKPGAKRLREVRQKIQQLKVQAVFAEPQFEPSLVRTVAEGTGARIGELDPLGADIPAGAGAWFTLMERLANALAVTLK